MSRVEEGSGSAAVIDEAMDNFDTLIAEVTGSPSPLAEKEKEIAAEQATDATPAAEATPATPAATTEDDKNKVVEFSLPEPLREFFPEGFKSQDEYVAEVRGIIESNDQLVELLDKDPALVPFLNDIKALKTTSPTQIAELAAKHFALPEEEIPDPSEDADAYKAFVQKQAEREIQSRQAREADVKVQETQKQQIAAQVVQLQSDFQKQENLSEEDMTKFLAFTRDLLRGKDGKLPVDLFPRLYRAYTYDEVVAKKDAERIAAEQKALVDGKVAGVLSTKTKAKADGLPDITPRNAPVAQGVNPELGLLSSMTIENRRVPL